ncbi:hypothetical protein [Microbacterium testaceum]|uniref:hypothetical protein n=1 Tax=Microbacterium testaceum TaxID=2033 RepID=UPI00128FC1AC|nr:hypothetical protein [Microbacterium testaceum]
MASTVLAGHARGPRARPPHDRDRAYLPRSPHRTGRRRTGHRCTGRAVRAPRAKSPLGRLAA